MVTGLHLPPAMTSFLQPVRLVSTPRYSGRRLSSGPRAGCVGSYHGNGTPHLPPPMTPSSSSSSLSASHVQVGPTSRRYNTVLLRSLKLLLLRSTKVKIGHRKQEVKRHHGYRTPSSAYHDSFGSFCVNTTFTDAVPDHVRDASAVTMATSIFRLP